MLSTRVLYMRTEIIRDYCSRFINVHDFRHSTATCTHKIHICVILIITDTDSLVGSTVVSQHKGSGFNLSFELGTFLCGVCRSCLCLCGFFLGIPVSCHSPKTCVFRPSFPFQKTSVLSMGFTRLTN